MKPTATLMIPAVILLVLGSSRPGLTAEFAIDWYTIDGGGGTFGTGGGFGLGGTIGQPDAGRMSGDAFGLFSGFWSWCQPGDFNGDGSLDDQDFAIFLAAFGRHTGEPAYVSTCDLDGDGTISLADYQTWLRSYRAFVGNPQAPVPVGTPGDLDFDGDVDLADFGNLQGCLAAPPERAFVCVLKFDFNGDGRVDMTDFAEFATVFSGP